MTKTVGAVIRELRKELGVSMRDLARLTGMATSYISMIETGARRDPGFRAVLRISKALGVSVEVVATRVEGSASAGFGPPGGPAAVARLRKAHKAAANTVSLLDDVLEKLNRAPTSPVSKRGTAKA